MASETPNTSNSPKSKGSTWDKTKTGGKAAFDKGWAMFEKLGVPVNKLTNKIGSEAFWPSSLDHESDKSARILKSFCSRFSPCCSQFHLFPESRLTVNRGWVLQRAAIAPWIIQRTKGQAQGSRQDPSKGYPKLRRSRYLHSYANRSLGVRSGRIRCFNCQET